jgi:hypothetical protein
MKKQTDKGMIVSNRYAKIACLREREGQVGARIRRLGKRGEDQNAGR